MASTRDNIQPSALKTHTAQNVRLGANDLPASRLNTQDRRKFVKLVGESRYALAAVGDPIDSQVFSVEAAPGRDGGSLGGIVRQELLYVTADGLQATPGVGFIAVGDYVVCGTPTPLNVDLGVSGYPKVCKATLQPGGVLANLAEVATLIKQNIFAHRVVSLGDSGTGAVGTRISIERIAPTQEAI